MIHLLNLPIPPFIIYYLINGGKITKSENDLIEIIKIIL